MTIIINVDPAHIIMAAFLIAVIIWLFGFYVPQQQAIMKAQKLIESNNIKCAPYELNCLLLPANLS